jgi:hypothetical protein
MLNQIHEETRHVQMINGMWRENKKRDVKGRFWAISGEFTRNR